MEDYAPLLEQLLQQERDLQFDIFTNQTALQLGNAILERAMKEEKLIVVDIRRNGQLLFHAKLEGTGLNNDRWIQRKINVANHFGHSSYYMHVLYKSWNTTIQENAFVDPMEYAAEGGSFPIFIKNVGPIGTISVSGLPGEEDHALVVTVLREFLNSV
ncbi:heme-degrading domain-containing protein [Cohnella sp. WQ 127256]|uniref:heme-degrading domain-containing protein n=1 Tax=Cohnella sp. WQ 127256 TaxID=2938790 RepID=UPI0021195C16|nr:heme-degrading domain-containing protein [Cohnella sp. WQ 127256]